MSAARLRYKSVAVGSLPVDKINSALGTEMEPGQAWLSTKAHRHMAEDHPNDYPACYANLRNAISDPTYVGQDPRHARNFILVKRLNPHNVLVAVSLEPNEQGNYHVRSAYLISSDDVERRRQNGSLKRCPS